MLVLFSQLASSARVWVYYSQNVINETVKAELSQVLDAFCTSWTAHNNALLAGWKWENKHFLILGVDESNADASGCSIDKSVALLRSIKEQTGIDFLNREYIPYLTNQNEVSFLKLAVIKEAIASGQLEEDTLLFQVAASQKSQLENNWLEKASETWAKRYFTVVNQ